MLSLSEGGSWQRGGESEPPDLEGAGLEEGVCRGFERAARRQHIIDEADPTLPIETARGSKCTP